MTLNGEAKAVLKKHFLKVTDVFYSVNEIANNHSVLYVFILISKT